MSRPRINGKGEAVAGRFEPGTLARIRAALRERETLAQFMRDSVEAELDRRENDDAQKRPEGP